MYIADKKLEDWGIVTGFTISAPSVRQKKYTIPGRAGNIDATEALTGYPVYDDRSLSITMYIKKKTPAEYQSVYDEIYKYCHGRVREVYFPFDNAYYYSGRLNVSVEQNDNTHGIVTIKGDVYPYVLKKVLTVVDISSASEASREVTLTNSGMPTKISVETDDEIKITRGDSEITFSAGLHVINTPLLIDNETITVEGAADASIKYQEGKL